MGEIKNSKLHANLDRDKMFGDAWWLSYCCCGGRAVGDVGNPFFASEGVQLCLHSTCEMTEVGNPFCSGMSVMCCVTQQCAFPKIDGSPTCVCFNKQLAGGSTGNWKPSLFEWSPEFGQQFWLYYFLCGGVGLSAPQANGRPIIGSMRKQLCIKEAVKCVQPCTDGILCSGLGTSLCCWEQVQFPPAENNPKFACCGWKMNKYGPTGSGGSKPAPFGYGKPGQQAMAQPAHHDDEH